jgi:hypothetical protein
MTTIQLELNLAELDFLLLAMRPLVADALTRTPCGPQTLAAEALECKLIAAFTAAQAEVRS